MDIAHSFGDRSTEHATLMLRCCRRVAVSGQELCWDYSNSIHTPVPEEKRTRRRTVRIQFETYQYNITRRLGLTILLTILLRNRNKQRR